MDGVAAEHIREAVPVIASYGDAIGIRAFARRENLEEDLSDQQFRDMISLVDIPYINMESAMSHPCQSLADWKTMDDLGVPASGGKFVLSWSWHPQAMPYAVPSSSLHMAAMRGMDVTVLRPEGYELPEPIMARARSAASLSGGSITETDDRAEAMEGANVIYVNSWSSSVNYGDKRAEEDYKSELRDWCVGEEWFKPAAPDCRFMHCLPVRREVTVTEAVLDGGRSVVIQEARNRMLVQMALLHRMLANR
jgi:N-acetylornithine carbamoyltransferase